MPIEPRVSHQSQLAKPPVLRMWRTMTTLIKHSPWGQIKQLYINSWTPELRGWNMQPHRQMACLGSMLVRASKQPRNRRERPSSLHPGGDWAAKGKCLNQNKESHVHMLQSPKENKNIISNKSYLFRLKGKLFRITETIHLATWNKGQIYYKCLKTIKR